MFTQSCIIKKNTLRLRDKLLELGYSYAPNGAGEWFIPIEKLHYLGVNLYSNGYYMGVNAKWNNFWIDCEDNEELFLALAALRDDSDKNQFFVLETRLGSINYPDSIIPEGAFMLCLEDKWFKDLDENDNSNPLSSFNIPSHKATVEELINFFKNK